ncbi:hypothetical protein D3C73_1257630 [compost metagenome]
MPIRPPEVHIETFFEILNCRLMPSATAASSAETAEPASTIRSGERFCRLSAAIPKTSITPIAAPIKHATIMPK